DDSAITVTPSEKIVLPEGEEVVVTASGAESYKWYKGTGENQNNANLLGTTENLSVNTLGFYTVIATVGSCSVQKTIEAIEQDNQQVVPNVITPNGDGKNDSWKISNRYAFQEEITVELYDSTGKLIVKTTDYKNDWPLEDLGNQVIFYYKIIRDNQIIKAGTISVLY
ncbi:T9SS type B sorting domain-containing protein, partial [Tenacibaculum piscium]